MENNMKKNFQKLSKMNIEQLVQDVIDGNEDPLLALALLKQQKTDIEKGLKIVEDAAFHEAAKYGKSFEHGGYKFTQTDGRKLWKFDNIQSWAQTKEQLLEIEGKAKAAYSAYEKNVTSISEDGEVLELPTVTFSKPSISVKKI